MILILLVENFIEVQAGKSRREAAKVTVQTLGMAVAGALVMRLWPEALRYSDLRAVRKFLT